MLNLFDALLLFTSALVGAALNSIAGGGSFLTFPALIFTGADAISANATSTAVLWPASAASAWGYRSELEWTRREWIAWGVPSVLGGVLGSLILMKTPESVFNALLPFLMLLATWVFWRGAHFNWVTKKRSADAAPSLLPWAALQFLIATYGGFFGGGMGLMMLAVLTMAGQKKIHSMNGVKNVLAVLINCVAAAVFVASGKILWAEAGIMVMGAMLGGYAGARVARSVNPQHIRRVVISVGGVLTVLFFLRNFR